jgi:hypothetical protein
MTAKDSRRDLLRLARAALAGIEHYNGERTRHRCLPPDVARDLLAAINAVRWLLPAEYHERLRDAVARYQPPRRTMTGTAA